VRGRTGAAVWFVVETVLSVEVVFAAASRFLTRLQQRDDARSGARMVMASSSPTTWLLRFQVHKCRFERVRDEEGGFHGC